VSARAALPLEPGAVIDGFRLEEKIHQGSMSTIWSVTHADGRTPMVMKIPLLKDTDDPAAIVGFEVEQMILPTLSGVHVPRFVASGDFSKQPYIVMEQIAGQSLRSRLDNAPLPAAEVAEIGAKVAAALRDIHSQHVTHLDLKPSNVMFRETGEAVLIDFGLSRHDRLPDLLAEQFRLPMGTAPYMSPEQVKHVRNEPRSDLFGLGVLLYHFATGARPFGNPVTVAGLKRRLYRGPVPPRCLNPNCPPWLQEIILHCLEIEPSDRYATAAQAAFELQHPEQVALTARAQRSAREGFGTVVKRWSRTMNAEHDPRQSAAGQLARAPIIVVAVDLTQTSEALTEALRLTAGRVLEMEPQARLACVTVQRVSRIAIDTNVDGEGGGVHVKRLVELKHWARLLGLPPSRITYHVLQAPDPANAILDFARVNHVDQIVIGSRGSSTFRRYLGSVSSQVVARAECTVTVVKAAHASGGDEQKTPRASSPDDLLFD
jgi:nucleotide-binding universal stress UspA family protein